MLVGGRAYSRCLCREIEEGCIELADVFVQKACTFHICLCVLLEIHFGVEGSGAYSVQIVWTWVIMPIDVESICRYLSPTSPPLGAKPPQLLGVCSATKTCSSCQ